MSLLTIVQKASRLLSLPVPTVVIGAADTNTVQLFELGNTEGEELRRRGDWEILTKEHTFTTVATADQGSSAFPSGFQSILNQTLWNRSQTTKVSGAISAQTWQDIQGQNITTGYDYYRIRGGSFLMSPTPTAGETIAYEYLSTNWCQSSGGTGQTEWAADDDTGILDEELIKLGLVWRFQNRQGLDYSEAFRTYELAIQDALAKDGGNQVVYLGGGNNERIPALVFPDSIPT